MTYEAKQCKKAYEWFMRQGETTSASMGTLSNTFRVAFETGKIPRWCRRGTPAYAAARAGIAMRKSRQ